MQESSRSFAGEKGSGRLKNLQRLLRMRQQYMVSQVSLLYPVKVVNIKAPEQELESFRSSIKSGELILHSMCFHTDSIFCAVRM